MILSLISLPIAPQYAVLTTNGSSNPSLFDTPYIMKDNLIYLDAHASTPVDERVLDVMLPYFTQHCGNGNHEAGWKTNSAREQARHQVSSLINARPSEILFTSGATESINLALLGLAKTAGEKRRQIVTQKTEHAAVLQCTAALEKQGFQIKMLNVDAVGRIDLNQLEDVVGEETLAVAIMLANNEIGTVQPIEKIGHICRQAGAKFFCDLTQGIGWHPIDVDRMNIDLGAMSSHKINGPRGVGALFIRRLRPKIIIEPILFGGGQEQGIRPGTSNIPGIVGFGKACELQVVHAANIYDKVRMLRDRLQHQLFSAIDGAILNGCPTLRHPGNLNMAIPGVSGEDLIGSLPNIMFSMGSACASGSSKPSHVLSALGADMKVLQGSFRFGVGKSNTLDEIDFVSGKIIQTAKELLQRRRSKTEAVTLSGINK
jgi:cysteine desulfurase